MIRFEKTYWTLIQRAMQDGKTALNDLARVYAPPIRSFIERSGFSAEDAEDLAQETLLIVCDPEFLKQADASKGKFRTLILLVVKNVMNGEWRKRYAKKRKGRSVSIDGDTIRDILSSPPPSDEAFDQEWWLGMLNRALERLEEENPKRHEILKRHKVDGEAHKRIAVSLGMKEDDVNNEVRAGKKRVREIVMELIRGYCSTMKEYEEELAAFQSRLK